MKILQNTGTKIFRKKPALTFQKLGKQQPRKTKNLLHSNFSAPTKPHRVIVASPLVVPAKAKWRARTSTLMRL